VWSALHHQQQANLQKTAATLFRYNSELVLDLSFEVWFRGGTLSFPSLLVWLLPNCFAL
jgi:hypothetical protein